MKLSTLQISVGLSLLTHGVIFSAFSIVQSGSGNCTETGAAPITLVLISEPVSIDANTSNPETVVEPHPTAQTSSLLKSHEPSSPTPPPLPEVASEDETPEPTPINSSSEEQVFSPDSPAAEDSSALPNTNNAPQAVPPTLSNVASLGAASGPTYLYNPAPRYPAKARFRGQQGTVVIAIRVNSDGLPDDVNVCETSGFDVLDRAALHAVKTWRFAPAQWESHPVETRVEIPIQFKLARTKTP